MNAKRILALILSICMTLTVATFPVMAENAVDGDYSTYYISSLYKGTQGDRIIDLVFEL